VKLRDADTVNKNIPTGEVELVADEIRILNESKLPPFLPSDTALTNEETRLKYRYIDLRRDVMQFNIETRHKVAKAIRDYLSAQGFFEIETPFMTRSTPEGARDYLVPSRVQPGTFYALPQSPQLFKQILMISGFDKYFQIVRCFRDEDLRADRQPEFTQIDLEMTYPQPERVWEVVEGFLTAAFKAAGSAIKTPFPRMDYDEAIRLYGIDKPDLRLPAFTDVRECFTPENLQELAINANSAGDRHPHSQGRRAFAQRARRHQAHVPRQGRREDYSRTSSASATSSPTPRPRSQKSWHASEDGDLIVLVAGSAQGRPADRRCPRTARSRPPSRRFTRRLDCCGWRWRRSMPTEARHFQEDRRPGEGFSFPVGHELPHVRVGRRREAMDGGASSVYFAA
jgi:aspartyl-tRNA synthetase